MAAAHGEEIEKLRGEIAELTNRLEIADAKNAQAGVYGLKLIEEKSILEEQYDQLKREFETTKAELEKTHESLNQFRNQQRNSALSEFTREEQLLADRENLERELTDRIRALEDELKLLKEKLDSTRQENERLLTEYQELRTRAQESDAQRVELRKELEELKKQEQRLLNENDELGDENVKLQRQISSLKAAQVDYEAIKMEVTRLVEDNQILQSAVEDNQRLKEFAEAEIERALNTAQEEREQRLRLKQELERMRNHEIISNLNNLYVGIENAAKERDEERLTALESSLIADGPIENAGGAFQAGGSDLFSEIHGGEISKLKEENERLSGQLEGLKRGIDKAIGPLLQKLQVAGDSSDIEKLKESVQEAIRRLDEKLKNADLNKAAEKRVEQIKYDMRQLIMLAGRKNAQLIAAQDRIVYLAEGLIQDLASAGEENNTEAGRIKQIQAELRKIAEQNAESDDKRSGSPSAATTQDEEADREAASPKLHTLNISRSLITKDFAQEVDSRLHAGLKLSDLLSEADRREKLAEETEPLVKSFDSFQELVRLLRASTERVAQSKALGNANQDLAELQQQLNKYRSLLNVKREQVTSLRTVLRSNKVANEGALNSVRSKYQSEMKIKDETIAMLRRELKHFKEDASTFASSRAMYTAANADLKSKNEQLKAELAKAEEEKQIVSQLLRIAIQQKLSANQRLADLEADREHQVQAVKRPIRQTNNNNNRHGGGGGQREVRAVRYPQHQPGGGANGNSSSGGGTPYSPRSGGGPGNSQR